MYHKNLLAQLKLGLDMLGPVTFPLGSASQHCRQATTTLPYIKPKALGLLDSRPFLRNESGVQESGALDRGSQIRLFICFDRHTSLERWHSTLYPRGIRTFSGFVPFQCRLSVCCLHVHGARDSYVRNLPCVSAH